MKQKRSIRKKRVQNGGVEPLTGFSVGVGVAVAAAILGFIIKKSKDDNDSDEDIKKKIEDYRRDLNKDPKVFFKSLSDASIKDIDSSIKLSLKNPIVPQPILKTPKEESSVKNQKLEIILKSPESSKSKSESLPKITIPDKKSSSYKSKSKSESYIPKITIPDKKSSSYKSKSSDPYKSKSTEPIFNEPQVEPLIIPDKKSSSDLDPKFVHTYDQLMKRSDSPLNMKSKKKSLFKRSLNKFKKEKSEKGSKKRRKGREKGKSKKKGK